jgi:ribose transport system permease protein
VSENTGVVAAPQGTRGSSRDTNDSVVKRILGGSIGRNLGLVIALVVLIAIGAITAGDRFMSVDNFLTIIRYASIIGVISIGLTFVITAGGIDLSVGSVMGLATVVASLTAVQLAATQSTWLLMIVIPLVIGVTAGFINGVVIAYGNVIAFMATLAMLVGARGLAELISGRRTQIVTNTGFLEFTRSNFLGVPLLIWIFLVVAVAAWILLNRTTFGRRTVAIGGNPEAARLAGLDVKRHTVLLYVVSGLCAGIAAIMIASLTTTGSSTHGTLYELDAIAAVIIGGTLLSGGRGTLIGSILGVLVFTTITNLFVLNNLATEVQNIAKGVIIVVAVLIQARAQRSSATP